LFYLTRSRFPTTMRPFLNRTFFILLFVLVGTQLLGQNKEELQRQKKNLQEEISYTNKLINETQASKRVSLNQLNTLDQKIRIREELMQTIDREIRLIDSEIERQNAQIDSLKNELDLLRDQYAEMIRQAYRSRSSYTRLMFLLSAQDFNQAYKRLQFLKQYNDFRRRQAERLIQMEEVLEERIATLQLEREEKEALRADKAREREVLDGEKQQQRLTVDALSDKERQLKKELRQKEKDAKKLESAIQRIIEEEIRKAREAARAKDPEGKFEAFAMTPEAKALSANFTSNRGKLPWPVERGIIVSPYGEQPHPVLRGITIKNDGIDIATEKGSIARACFEGTVSAVIRIPGAGRAVVLRHGEYLTVYGNLNEVYVTQGQTVATKEMIGTVRTDGTDDQTVLQFQLWKGSTKQNPEPWLFK
jgi:septal ring factor EnvC (AmiA/AmiB activator)